MASLVQAPVRLKNTPATRSRPRPARSSASIVLAKLGGAGSAAMASISAASAASVASKAGGKCSGETVSNGGAPNGVFQVARRGLSIATDGVVLTMGSLAEERPESHAERGTAT